VNVLDWTAVAVGAELVFGIAVGEAIKGRSR
jgi:hypothetical protein